MTAPIQARTLKTRARLTHAAQEVIAASGYGEMRVEDVVRRAGVAKGTFFAHFHDKDALMDQLIGAKIDAFLDDLEGVSPPKTVDEIINALTPMMTYMTCERYVFDVILRHSGAAAKDEIGPIAMTFYRFIKITAQWLDAGHFRQDANPDILAEGLQSFVINSLALNFCALHKDAPLSERLKPYLDLWLMPANRP